MTTGLSAIEERRRHAQFSRPIWALPDGLLVRKGNQRHLTGYQSLAENADVKLAVIRDQFQHSSAVEFGVSEDRINIFETYIDAARAVREGEVDTYASVDRTHSGFIERYPDWPVELDVVPCPEKPPAFGSFAFSASDTKFLSEVDKIVRSFIGTLAHREMAACFGFSSNEVDLLML